MHGHKEGNRFFHDDTSELCNILTDPIVSKGIVYYEVVFYDHDTTKHLFGLII